MKKTHDIVREFLNIIIHFYKLCLNEEEKIVFFPKKFIFFFISHKCIALVEIHISNIVFKSKMCIFHTLFYKGNCSSKINLK